VPRDYPVEKLLTGNAAAGKTYFFGAGHCDTCHSPTGDLAGVAKKYTPINLEARFLYPGGGRRSVTVTTPSGEKVSGTLAHLDEFNVALRDGTGWYRSWPRDRVQVEVRDPIEKHRELLQKYTDADVHNLFAYLETLK
jgi:cytochrome c oxidase cbb3-type subunit 3